MSKYITPLGYIVNERIGGMDIYEDGTIVCVINGSTLEKYRDENENIDDDMLESDIKNAIEVEDFIDDQQGNC